MKVSVVICTHNRPTDVARCVDALNRQKIGSRDWELLLVDSNSRPDHAKELLRICEAAGNIRILRLNELGLSRARNVAAANARGEWLVYLDDDAEPSDDWAQQLSTFLDGAGSSVAMVGGRIEPAWPSNQSPAGITDRWLLLLSCIQDLRAGCVRDGKNVCGANFAIRREVLVGMGGFPEHLGRIGERLISGEESYVASRLIHGGFEVLYEPSFVVLHHIARERLTRAWVARRAYWEGVTQVFLRMELEKEAPWSLRPAKLLASIPILCLLRWAIAWNADYLIRSSMALGSVRAYVSRAFTRKGDRK